MNIAVTDLRLAIGHRTLLDGINLRIATGAFVGIIGPNGAGKSTLLRVLYRGLRPTSGAVLIGGTDVWRTRPRTAARQRAVVTQHQSDADGLRVRDVVATGRYARQRWFESDTTGDHAAVDDALVRCQVEHLRERQFATLSGGERQRVLLARALAQDAPVLLLDEPTNHLDVTAQLDTLRLLGELTATRVVVLHDLDHAVGHADHLVVVDDGSIVAAGPPVQVFTPELALRVFGVRAAIVDHPLTGRPHVATAIPDGRCLHVGSPIRTGENGDA